MSGEERVLAGAAAAAGAGLPVLRVVRGEPSAEELAALVAVVAAGTPSRAAEGPPPRSVWADRSRLVRRAVRPGPGGWRASGRPG